MALSSSADAAQRARCFAKLLKEVCQQVTQPLADVAGIAWPPLSKRKLAVLLGVSSTLILKYENADIDPFDIRWGLMNRIAEVLGLSLEDLKTLVSEPQVSVDWKQRSLTVLPKPPGK